MSTTYAASSTAILLVDPYNDFLAPEGKLWPAIKATAEEVDLHAHLRQIVDTGREAGIKIFFVPHHRAEPGDYSGWKHATKMQLGAGESQVFAKGSWGGEFHDDFRPQLGDVIVKEHWAQSGFANTDLDQQLKQFGIEKLVLIGLVANSCIESTGRYGMELGYHVTLVKDATAAFSHEGMHAAHDVNGPMFAHEICTTAEITASIKRA